MFCSTAASKEESLLCCTFFFCFLYVCMCFFLFFILIESLIKGVVCCTDYTALWDKQRSSCFFFASVHLTVSIIIMMCVLHLHRQTSRWKSWGSTFRRSHWTMCADCRRSKRERSLSVWSRWVTDLSDMSALTWLVFHINKVQYMMCHIWLSFCLTWKLLNVPSYSDMK